MLYTQLIYIDKVLNFKKALRQEKAEDQGMNI